MSRILLIKNLEELNYIKRNLKHLLRTHKIISACSLPWLKLYGEGFSVEQACDYLSEDEFKHIVKEARFLSRVWYKPFGQLLDYRGINLGELVRLDLIWFFRELIASYLAMQRIIDVHKPGEIAIFTDLDFPNLSASRYDGTSDIFPATVIWMCATNKIRIHKLRLKRNFKKKRDIFWRRIKRKIARYSPLILFFYRYLKRLSKNIIYRSAPGRIPLSLFPKVAHKKLAIALGSSFELLVLKEVIKTLSDPGDFNVVPLNLDPNFNVRQLKNRCGLDVELGLEFVCLDDFNSTVLPKSLDIISSLQKARRFLESDTIFKSDFLPVRISGLLRNPNLAVQFDFVWSDYFYEAIPMIDKIYEVYRQLHPDVVIAANLIGYTQRVIVKLAKNFKARSVTLPHGWVGDMDEYEFDSDLFLAWGELSQKQLIEEFNKSAHNIAVVGAVQFDRFIPSAKQSSDDNVKKIKERFGLRLEAQVILIMTGDIAQSVFAAVDMKRFLECWEFIKFFIVEHPEIDFILRPHPTEMMVEWYRQLVKDLDRPNLKIIEEVKLDAFLPVIDVGISTGVPSTANYLCMLFGIPIIIFKSFLRTNLLSTLEAWNEENGLLVAKQEKDLVTLIMQLLNDNNFRQETIEREQIFLDKSLLIRDGKAREKIAQAISNLCNDKNKSRNRIRYDPAIKIG